VHWYVASSNRLNCVWVLLYVVSLFTQQHLIISTRVAKVLHALFIVKGVVRDSVQRTVAPTTGPEDRRWMGRYTSGTEERR
jgi:hypothetical protein